MLVTLRAPIIGLGTECLLEMAHLSDMNGIQADVEEKASEDEQEPPGTGQESNEQ